MAHRIIDDGMNDTGAPMSAINVTPLVDVMFCLLIIFMVAAPLMSPPKSSVNLPPGKGEKISEEEFLYTVISIDATGTVFLGTLPLSKDREKMKEELAGNVKIKEDGRAFIQADEAVQFEVVVDVLAAMKEAEIAEVGFVTDPNARRIKELTGQ
jgi:biopolymer transport protein TolR